MVISYYKIELNSIEKNSLLKEMDDEGLITKVKSDERVHVARFLKICKIVSASGPDTKGAPIEKKWTLVKLETLNMDTTESNEAVNLLSDIGKELAWQWTKAEIVFDIR